MLEDAYVGTCGAVGKNDHIVSVGMPRRRFLQSTDGSASLSFHTWLPPIEASRNHMLCFPQTQLTFILRKF